MKRELIIKKCKSCGAIIKVMEDCNCPSCKIKCCEESMETLIPNTTEASFESHIPNVEVLDSELIIEVNHVMEESHYIKWIAIISNEEERFIYFNPGEKAKVKVKYEKDAIVYAYCNKHDLWMKQI